MVRLTVDSCKKDLANLSKGEEGKSDFCMSLIRWELHGVRVEALRISHLQLPG
jgi:hypothetical protein